MFWPQSWCVLPFSQLHCTAGLTAPSTIGLGLESAATFVEVFLALSTLTSFYASETLCKAVVSTAMTIMGELYNHVYTML